MRRLCGLALLSTLAVFGQTAPKPLAFEIADVHVSEPATNTQGGFTGNGVSAHGFNMLQFLTMAYDVDKAKIVGGASWVTVDRFDIDARAMGLLSPEAHREMLRNLLAERFHLVARKEMREIPVYGLSVSRKGLKLRETAAAGAPRVTSAVGDPSVTHGLFHSYTMAQLALELPGMASNFVDRPVVDLTNRKGSYDFQLDWMDTRAYVAAKANGAAAISVFDGLEKIGLHLEPQKRPMEAIVIESVNRVPTPNPAGVKQKAVFPTEFEVAEVRPAKSPGGESPGIEYRNGRLQILNWSLKSLVLAAFDFSPERSAGFEKWMDEDRFDVIAKAPADAPFTAASVMFRNLLAERFQLKTHTEERPMPVFVLLAGKKPKLKESDGTARSECKLVLADHRNFVCQNTTMAEFAERLPNFATAYVRPPLLDETGIKGNYDLLVYWTPKALLSRGRDGSANDVASLPNEFTMFEAVDRMLGLKIEEQKRPLPILVIDHADRVPTEK